MNKRNFVFLSLVFMGLIERYLSFYSYQFVGVDLIPSLLIEFAYFYILLTIFFKKKIFFVFGLLFTIQCLYYFSQGYTSGYGETFVFYLFLISLNLLEPKRVFRVGGGYRGNFYIWSFFCLLILYYISTLWGDIYYANNAENRTDFYGFMWPHMLGYVLYVYAVVLTSYKKYLWSIVILVIASLSPSRTATLLSLIGLIIVFFKLIKEQNENGYVSSKNNRLILKIIFLLMIGVYLFGVIYVVFNYKNIEAIDRIILELAMLFDSRTIDMRAPLIVNITSGRSLFWVQMWEHFVSSQTTFFDILFGLSPKGVRQLNERNFGLYIWMHNDILQALFAHGIVGLIVYVYSVIKFLRAVEFDLMIVVFFIVTIIMNGFFPYISVMIVYLFSNYFVSMKYGRNQHVI